MCECVCGVGGGMCVCVCVSVCACVTMSRRQSDVKSNGVKYLSIDPLIEILASRRRGRCGRHDVLRVMACVCVCVRVRECEHYFN